MYKYVFDVPNVKYPWEDQNSCKKPNAENL